MDSCWSPLQLEAPFYSLGADFYDPVAPARFGALTVRYRGGELTRQLGLDPGAITDEAWAAALGRFDPLPGHLHGPLAQRYIGHQFRVFNPHLGDGRGFLLAQVRCPDGRLLDLGTKGSGTTPWSRGGDGFLTLKGGVRELIAAEFLHAMGVKTSRPLSLIEQDARLWRGDEPSPTRSSILVRAQEGHVRFGTFERIFYLVREEGKQRAMMSALADHVVQLYYPHLMELPAGQRWTALFGEVTQRTAAVVAGWIRAGFCHGVLNTDNMSLSGDSFDYGPWAFMQDYDPTFTAAYFDHGGLYAFEAQPDACYWNLAMLARTLTVLVPAGELEERLGLFPDKYRAALRAALLPRLGFVDQDSDGCRRLLAATLEHLKARRLPYHGFFLALADRVSCLGVEEGGPRLPGALGEGITGERWREVFAARWRQQVAAEGEGTALAGLRARLSTNNPRVVPWRPEVERVWAPIDEGDDWRALNQWLQQLASPFTSVQGSQPPAS